MKVKAIGGVLVTLMLMSAFFYVAPILSTPEPIKIGVIADTDLTEGIGLWQGAVLAKEEINTWNDGKGVNVGGVFRKIDLVYIDEHAMPLDPAGGVLALEGALPEVDFLVGGFRSECVFPMRETAMAYAAVHNKPIWIITGSATTRLIDCGYPTGHPLACGSCVRCNYDRYKYMFRVTPQNDTFLFKSVAMYLRMWVLPARLAKIYGGAIVGVIPKEQHPLGFDEPIYENPIKTYIVAENLVWADVPCAALAGSTWIPEIAPGFPNPYPSPPAIDSVLGPNAIVVAAPARPYWMEEDFSTILADIDAKNARLIIHIFSAVGGIGFIKQWGKGKYNALPCGINVESQSQAFWEETYDVVEDRHLCEYESFLDTSGTRTPIVPGKTEVFWDNYQERFDGDNPVYTSYGSYDALITMAEAIQTAGTLDSDILLPTTEMTDRIGILGRFRYTGPHPMDPADYPYSAINPNMMGTLHDVLSTPDCLSPIWPSGNVRAQIPQWQAGRREVVYPVDQPYSRRLKLPIWMYPYVTDLNYDGKIDIDDVVQSALAFGSYPGHPRWDPEAELTGDGKIDIDDVILVCIDFGKWIPLPLPM